MKLTVTGEQLKKGVKLINKITKRKSALETLENVLIESEKNFIKMIFTNLETGILYQSLAKIEKEGKICVKRDIFEKLISFIDEEDIIDLEEKENFLLIKSEKFNSKTKKFSYEDFPVLPLPKEEKYFLVNGKNFTENLRTVLDFTSPSLEKPEISGVLIKVSEKELIFVATDSFRLGEKKSTQKIEGDFPVSFIIPQESAKEIFGIFNNFNEGIKIYYLPHQIFIEKKSEEGDFPEVIYVSRLIEGTFPEYEGVIPKKFEVEVNTKTSEILRKIKMASIFTKKTNEIELKFLPKENKIKILSENIDLGSFETEISSEIKGKEISVLFNYEFLEKGISAIDDPELFIGISGEDKPALFKPKNLEDFVYILMPIRKE
jgi:DNA polymerase-3 subunit beta